MIRYECNVCGELIEDEENMEYTDVLYQRCADCVKAEEEEDEN